MSAVFLAVVAVSVLPALLLPVRSLPSVALAWYVILPLPYLDVPQLLQDLPPTLLTLVVWQVRARLDGNRVPTAERGSVLLPVLLLVLAGYLVVGTYVMNEPLDSTRWMANFLALVVVFPILSRGALVGTREIPATWAALSGILGLYAVLEKFVWEANPLYGQVFATSTTNAVVQEWAGYRATTTLGHPLVNAVFLGSGALMALWILVQRRRSWALPAAVLATVGTLATVSRSGLIALLAGGAVILVAVLVLRGIRFGRLVAALPVVAAVGWLAYELIGTRVASGEAEVSSAFRTEVFRAGLQALERSPLWGYGAGGLPGAGDSVGITTGGNFENSWLDLSLAAGAPAAVLLIVVLLVLAGRLLRSGDVGPAAAVLAFGVSLSSFNLLFGHPGAPIMLGMLLLIGSPTRAPRSRAVARTSDEVAVG